MKPYAETIPPAALLDTVECFWSHESGPTPSLYRVLPDGCLDLLVTTAHGKLEGYVIGAMSTFKSVELHPNAITAGIRFLPGQAARHLRLPLEEIRDQRVDLEAALGSKSQRWMDAAASGDPSAIWKETLALVGTAREASPTQQAAAWAARHQTASLEAMRQFVWISERQFRRRFLREAGIGAKQYLRVMRVRRALATLRREPPANLALFANEQGFCDQAHCSSEFRELTGESPSAWLHTPEP